MSLVSHQSILFDKIDFLHVSTVTTLHQLLLLVEFHELHEVIINGLYYIRVNHLI